MTGTFPEIAIGTDRLVLRPFEAADVPVYAEMMNDELVVAWTCVPHPYTADDAHLWVSRTAPAERTAGRGVVFAVAELLTARLVGVVQLQNTDWRRRTTEVACVVAPWARGEGYAAETVLAVAGWLFEEQKFARLELRTAAGNVAAQQVAQKVGCTNEGVLRSAGTVRTLEVDGRWTEVRTDTIVWSLLPEDLDSRPVATAATYPDWC